MILTGAAARRNKVTASGRGKSVPRADLLLAWYDRHRRVLPWRARPGEIADPYLVWLSEIMLQQTTVKAVGPYFLKFVARWPSVTDMAAASLDDVLRMWAGLGYYSRARNLHACAVTVARDHGGAFPGTEEGLRQLPGIGPYTAAAIAAIAFERQTMPVDGNIERVVSRLYAVEDELPKAKPEIQRLAATLLGPARGRFRAGVVGSRCHDLHAEETRLRAVSAERRLRGAHPRQSGDVSAQGAEEDRRVAAGGGVCGHARQRVAGADAARERSARRHARGAGFGLACCA
jgi:endonuclease III